jgi:Aminotransferase class I and II
MIFGAQQMNNNKNNLIVPDRKKLPYGGAEAVVSQHLIKQVDAFMTQASQENCVQNLSLQEQFIEQYRHWILSTTVNTVIGLDQFAVAGYSNGTTEGFDKFYLKHHTKRFRCFRGEYMYHMASWKTYFPSWQYIDDAPLERNDAVVISFPFSDSGQEHPQLKEILDQCAKLNIPVLLDCAYFGLCSDMVFDFSHPAITDITFSFSKFLPVAHLRIGIRFTRVDDDDSLLICNKTLYTNRLGAAVGIKIMNMFSPDYIVNKYKSSQIKLCKELDVVPSKSIIFGIDYKNQYTEYYRGGNSNRLSLAKHLDLNQSTT